MNILTKKNILLALLLIFSILLVCGWVNERAELKEYKDQMLKFEIDEQRYLEAISEDGTFLAEQEQIILSQKDAINNHLLEIKNLKKIKSQVIVNTITKVDSVFIPFVSDTTIKDTLLLDNYIFVPQKFSLLDDWYSFDGTIKKGGVLLDSISFNNKISLTIGNKSMGFFKKSKPIVLVEYSNPYVRTTAMQNIIIKDDLRFYDKKGFWYGFGVVSGIGVVILINK
tara:strand:- start:2572 stop:3249 length:678 start_codon:yes stop_codon:yes gene_type:complete